MQFHKIDEPPFAPKNCVCGHGKPPFVDTGMEKPWPVEHIYLCSRCVDTAARILGYVDAQTHDDLAEIAFASNEREKILEQELEAARTFESRVVAVEDLPRVVDLLTERQKRRPEKTPA